MAHFSINREGNGNYKTRCRWIDFDNEKDKLTISAALDLTRNESIEIVLTKKEKLDLIHFLLNAI